MPIATQDEYKQMIFRAKENSFAYPAINVTSSSTLHAALRGLSDANTNGIIQISTGGADFLAGCLHIKDKTNRASGAVALADFAHTVAKNYPTKVALHTDHCPKEALDNFLLPLIDESTRRVKQGAEPLFSSHMWDGSALDIDSNLRTAQTLLPILHANGQILEVEIGVVGGEEDGIKAQANAKLYTTLEDAIKMVDALGLGEQGQYMAALTFGNVHGVYSPGHVKLRPELLGEIQAGIFEHFGQEISKLGSSLPQSARISGKPLDLVFHGGSGSSLQEIRDAVSFGVIKMNIDTDTQYAYSRAIAHSVFSQYDGFLKIENSVGNKKVYDPRSWGQKAEASMAERVVQAAFDLGCAGSGF